MEALSTLSLCQVKHLQLIYEDRQLSTEAVNLISEYIDNFPRKENTDLEPDNAHDDDSNKMMMMMMIMIMITMMMIKTTMILMMMQTMMTVVMITTMVMVMMTMMMIIKC